MVRDLDEWHSETFSTPAPYQGVRLARRLPNAPAAPIPRPLRRGDRSDLSRAHNRIFRVASELARDVAMGGAEPRDGEPAPAIQATLQRLLSRSGGPLISVEPLGQEIGDEDYIRTIRTIAVRCHDLPGPVEDAAQRLSYTWSTAGKEKPRPGQCWAWMGSGWDENRKIWACTNPLDSRFPS